MLMQHELFTSLAVPMPVPVVAAEPAASDALSQYFTPAWMAEILYDAHFQHLTSNDLLLDPGTGKGACLAAVPSFVPAFGIETDKRMARETEERTGRRVIVGDFCEVPLPEGITAVFGNPPFKMSLVERLLARCAEIMPDGSKCGLILPAYFFQTSSTVVRLNQRWTIAQEFIPRDLFKWPKQMEAPVVFALFTRDNAPRLVGFRGYKERSEISELDAERQRLLNDSFRGPRSVWREVLATVLRELGGEAPLSEIYRKVEGRRPTGNSHWKEQIRKVAQRHFCRMADGVYALPLGIGQPC
jgi:site-specific DNA-methyltransferase (adenine-specific)